MRGLTLACTLAAVLAACDEHGSGPTPPRPPGSVGATAEGATAIVVEWIDSPDAASAYRIYRDGAPLVTLPLPVPMPRHQDGGLAHASRHCYAMTAIGDGGEGPRSGEACATTARFSITSPDPGMFLSSGCSIATGPDGSLHVAHVDRLTGALRYATNAPGAWTARELLPEGVSGLYSTGLEVDGDGHVHLVFQAASIGYATDTTGSWTFEDVCAGTFSGGLALDAGGAPRVALVGETNETVVVVASRSESGWSEAPLAPATCCVPGTDLTFDGDGHLHVSFGRNGDLWAGTDASGTFEAVYVAAADEGAIGTDPAGATHLALIGSGLVHATVQSGAWVTTPVAGGLYGYEVAIGVDPGGHVHLAAPFIRTAGGVAYAVDGTGAWEVSELEGSDDRSSLGLAVDAEGGAHLCFRGEDDGLAVASSR